MAATSLAYGSLDAAAQTLHPFHQLLQKNLRFRELFFEPLGEFTLRAIVYSTRRGYFALTAILITSLLGPTLTIVTSGLFTTTSIQFPDAITVDVRSWFNIETDPLGIEAYSLPCRNPGQVTSTAIEFGNVSYPQWTYKDLAFAGISLKPDELKSASSVTARVPAIRPKMNCTIQDFYDRSNNSFISSDDTYVRFPGPPGCGFGLDLSPVTILNGSYYDSFYVGTWLPSDPMLEQAWGEVDIYSCSDDRAHAWFEVARFDEGKLQDFSLVHCMPYVEVLHTIVTFTVPDLEIDLSNGPPRPDDSAEPSRFFNNITMQPICMNTVNVNVDRSSGDALDPFFTTAVMGRQGVPMAELANPANPEPLLHRMQEVYGANVVQGLNHLFRVPVASNASLFEASDMLTSPLNATLAVNRQRLVQSMLATRILEAVLLAMAVCAGVHFALTPNARILPKDPGSVAAKMSLFAGSELIRQLPEGENQEFETAFGNRVVSLGWWGDNGGGEAGSGGESERRFGIDLRPAAEE